MLRPLQFTPLNFTRPICPGCLRNFAMCPDYALDMIFEMCHYHSHKCDKRKKDHIFWMCKQCNKKQNDVCGYYENGKFIKTC